MSKRTWVTADTHFGHQLMAKLRPWDTIEEHDEAIIDNWNSLVAPQDRVYVLGDLCMSRRHVGTISRCNGKKVLVKGNHDIFKLKDYLPHFDDIRAYIVKPKHGLIMSHIPIHPQSMGTRYRLNVHGHLHENIITETQMMRTIEGTGIRHCDPHQVPDTRYRCVSMEQTDYQPVDLMEIINGI